jgi:hypothetical protein
MNCVLVCAQWKLESSFAKIVEHRTEKGSVGARDEEHRNQTGWVSNIKEPVTFE